LYSHTAAKLIFVRLFRHTRHISNHTLLGWSTWVILCCLAVAIACILAISVPIFNYLIGITASLFASWFTYGIAGFFWLYDTYHFRDGWRGIKRRPFGFGLALLTILAGTFICVAGTYVSIKVSYCPFLLDSSRTLIISFVAYYRCIHIGDGGGAICMLRKVRFVVLES
jgi:hypothetical protein